VLVEQDQVPPVRILLEELDVAVDRPPPVGPAQEDAGQPPRELHRGLPQREALPRAVGKLPLALAAVEVIEALERLDDEEVHREPDRPAPVRVAAEQSRR